MKINNNIPVPIVNAATALLQPYLRELSPVGLVEALEQYEVKPAPADKLVSIAEAARRLNISTMTLYRHIKAGKLHKVKIGYRSGIDADELRQAIGHGLN